MSSLQYQSTWAAVTGPGLVSVTALAHVEVSGGHYVLVLDSGGQSLRILQRGQSLVEVAERVLPGGSQVGLEAGLEFTNFPTGSFVLMPGLDQGGISGVSLSFGGVPGPVQGFSGAAGPGVSDVQYLSFADGRHVLVSLSVSGGQLNSYQVATDGKLQLTQSQTLAAQSVALASVGFEGHGVLLAASGVDNAVRSWRVAADGTLAFQEELTAAQGLFISTPTIWRPCPFWVGHTGFWPPPDHSPSASLKSCPTGICM